MATASYGWDSFFSTTLSSAISASDTTIPLVTAPTAQEGTLVIEADSSTNREIIYYTSVSGNSVVCPSVGAGRGQEGTSAVAHSSGVSVKRNTTSRDFEVLQDGTAFSNSLVLPSGVVKPEDLVAGAGTTWAWQSWVPTWTGITPGNGVNTIALYAQIGKTVYVRGAFTGGTTSSGTGVTPILTLPVTSASTYSTNSTPLGHFRYASSSLLSGYVRWASTTTVSLVSYTVSGATIIDGNLAVAFANTYVLNYNFFYEAA